MAKKKDTLPGKKPEKQERTCLRCNKTFRSTGPGNRLCSKCSKATGKASSRQTYPDPPD